MTVECSIRVPLPMHHFLRLTINYYGCISLSQADIIVTIVVFYEYRKFNCFEFDFNHYFNIEKLTVRRHNMGNSGYIVVSLG